MPLPPELQKAQEDALASGGRTPAEMQADTGGGEYVAPAGTWETLKRIPLRSVLTHISDPGQRARIWQKFADWGVSGLGEDAEIISSTGGDLMVKQGGKTTPMDPDQALGTDAETLADAIEIGSRTAPALAGQGIGLGISAELPGSSGPLQAIGAGAGEVARQVGESAMTHALLGESPKTSLGERATDVALTTAAGGLPSAVGKAAKGTARFFGVLPSETQSTGNVAARAAMGRVREEAKAQGIEGAQHARLGVGEGMGTQWDSAVAQLRRLASGPQEEAQLRGQVLHTLLSNIEQAGAKGERELNNVMKEQVAASRKEGIELVRDLTRVREEVSPSRAMEVSKARTREFIDRNNEAVRPIYEQSAQAMRDAGSTLEYESDGVYSAFAKARGTPNQVLRFDDAGRPVIDPATGKQAFTTSHGELPAPLEAIMSRVQAADAAGWVPLTTEGITHSPEDQILGMIRELGSMKNAFKNGTFAERAAAHHINSIRSELNGMLDNPVVTGGRPELVRASIALRKHASDQFRSFRSIMDRVESKDLDTGTGAVDVFKAFTTGEGARYHDIIANVPELRDAALGYWSHNVTNIPEEWADNILKTNPGDLLAVLGGDTPANRETLRTAIDTAQASKHYEGVVDKAIRHEVGNVDKAGKLLFSPDKEVGSRFRDEVAAMPENDPARKRAAASIVSWLFDQASVRKTNTPSFIDPKKFAKGMKEIAERGYVPIVPEHTMRILKDIETAQTRMIGSGGLEQGLAVAEAGGKLRVAGGEAILGGGERGRIGKLMDILTKYGGGNAVGLILTNQRTAAAFEALTSTAASGAQRFKASLDFARAMTMQGVASAIIQRKNDASDRRAEENKPVPAGL